MQTTETVLLGDVVEVFVGVTEARLRDRGEKNPIVMTRDVNEGCLPPLARLETRPLTPGSALDRFRLREGDVIVSGRGPLKVAVVGPQTASAILGANLICLRPLDERLQPGVLRAFFELPEVRDELMSRASGAVLPLISVTSLKQLRVPLLPVNSQRCIAALLQASDESYQAALAALEHRRQTVALAMRALLLTPQLAEVAS